MPEIHVGTSGWTYDDWTGPFYPEKVKGPERLSYYASRFDTVEVNASFYRFPTQNMIKAWNRRLGEEFHLVVKGHRKITHQSKLVDCESSLAGFLERVAQLEREVRGLGGIHERQARIGRRRAGDFVIDEQPPPAVVACELVGAWRAEDGFDVADR